MGPGSTMGKHVPHVVVGAPWSDGTLTVSVLQQRHLTKVLRLHPGDMVTYTDGLGTVGDGRLTSAGIERGEERFVERPSSLTVAVSPPASKDRQRFLVEKLAELGVQKLVWIESRHGEGRAAKGQKVFSWILSAVEQSRGAWMLEVADELQPLAALGSDAVYCDPTGTDETPDDASVVVVGPEGGFGSDEIPDECVRWSLGSTILRVETAAIVAAARLSNG